MTGFVVAILAWGVFCTALLIFVLGCLDDIRAELRAERARRVLEHTETQIQIHGHVDPEDVRARLERALRTEQKTRGRLQ